MQEINHQYETIVIGAGHAGCEAALALARKNHRVLLTTINLDSVAFLACNPSIGGTAKGHLVCEIDALGGEMGVNTDKTLIQIRMLNLGKGAAVHSLRAQADKITYHAEMKKTIENHPNISLKQAEIVDITLDGEQKIITTALGEKYAAKAVIICSGVYLNSRIIIGDYIKEVGPNGFEPANKLTDSLRRLGMEIRRFKTGTPARINGKLIDFSRLEIQQGDEDIQSFSFLSAKTPKNKAACYLTYTNAKTHQILRDNFHLAPLFSGIIEGVGARYCPSIEDKINRFPDRERHQVFLEPESLSTSEFYVQGVSTSMPAWVQEKMYPTIDGLENIEIMRHAYAIEYDCIDATQLRHTLECKHLPGVFFAGQVNGTSGYEEAAAQGIMAGINAALFLENRPPFVLARNEAYIGVLIDDLISKGTNEPYRMMTSRAEYRLFLRQDNADFRLTPKGYHIGLVDKKRYKLFCSKMKKLEEIRKALQKKIPFSSSLTQFYESHGEKPPAESVTCSDMLKRAGIGILDIQQAFAGFETFSKRLLETVESEMKYEGYIHLQHDEIEKMKKLEEKKLSGDIDYHSIKGLRKEAQEKLSRIRPGNLGQASRISGVSPADVSVLSIFLKLKG